MRQRSKLNVKKVGLFLACLGIVGLTGCVLDEVKELGSECPNLEYIKTEYGNLKCSKVGNVWTSAGCKIESSTEEHDQKWLEKLVEDNHYLGSFEYGICPDTFICQAGGCVPPGETGKVQCVIGDETVLIDPNSNKDHCGAKGKCNSQDSSSEDYIGIIADGDTGAESEIKLYTKEGRKKFTKKFQFNYETVEIINEDIIFNNGTDGMIIRSNGKTKFKGSFKEEVECVMPYNNRDKYILVTPQNIERVKFTN